MRVSIKAQKGRRESAQWTWQPNPTIGIPGRALPPVAGDRRQKLGHSKRPRDVYNLQDRGGTAQPLNDYEAEALTSI